MQITFEQLPYAISLLLSKMERLENLLDNNGTPSTPSDEFLCIEETSTFLQLAKPTVYALVSKREIPHFKKGKRLYFSKEELNQWIIQGKKKTVKEQSHYVDSFLSKLNPHRK